MEKEYIKTGIKDLTEGELVTQLEFAKEVKDKTLQNCVDRLANGYEGTIVNISKDFAPRSFYFSRMKGENFMGNGGIIYHGSHDNGGDGSAPTFSVSLTPVNGWSIHT